MGKKKPIDCPIELGGCCSTCKEVGYIIGYPKQIPDTRTIAKGKLTERHIHGYEYRYVCPNCGKEWLHDTLHNHVVQITTPSVKIELRNGEEIYIPQRDYMLDYFGLGNGKNYELTVDDIKDIQKKDNASDTESVTKAGYPTRFLE